ncbi:MAG TPA: hypothetical protein ENI27_00435 [bacterium]|nr:hypothetical protein [bacterium]
MKQPWEDELKKLEGAQKVEFKTYQVTLEEKIAKRIEEAASSRGVTVEAYLQFQLGEFFREVPQPPCIVVGGGQAAGEAKDMKSFMTRMMVVTQNPTCSSCTRKLKAKDIEEGKCPYCGEEI